MATLRNAISDHALPYRIKAKAKLTAVTLMPAKVKHIETPRHKSNDELLTDSKQMVSKLKANIAKDISSLESEQPPAPIPAPAPGAPKSPRLRLPLAIPEPDKSSVNELTFKVPISPRK